jgi:LacI family transcriptional regulator
MLHCIIDFASANKLDLASPVFCIDTVKNRTQGAMHAPARRRVGGQGRPGVGVRRVRKASVSLPDQSADQGSAGKDDRRPTLKTIAYMTGLGVTTVSRALKDAPDIGLETKRRVRLIADQIGYRPNRAGVRLRTGKTNVISLILETNESVVSFMAAMIYGISERLLGTSYHLVVTPSLAHRDMMDPIRYVVETGSADGIIISRIEPDDRRVRYLIEKGVPFATHGRTQIEIPHAFVDFDNDSFSDMAVTKLVGAGRRRLALLGPPPFLTYSRHMSEGFARAVEAHSVSEMPLRDIDIDASPEVIRDLAIRLASRKDRPDGIVVASGAAGIAFISGYESQGLVLGEDFDMVTKETIPFQQWYRPKLMVIPEDFRAAGRDLADAVMRAIDGENPRDLQKVVGPDRESA